MATTNFASDANDFASDMSNSNAATSVSNASSMEGGRELEEEPHVPEYEQFKNAILARNKANFDALGIANLVKSMRGKGGADNNIGNAVAGSVKQRARMHGGSGKLGSSGSRLKAPRKRARLLSTYALPPPTLFD
jgi:hypothetical protein